MSDTHLVSHKVGGVKSHTELTDHADISTGRQSLHEALGALGEINNEKGRKKMREEENGRNNVV